MKRTTSLTEFAAILDEKVNTLRRDLNDPKLRVYQITAAVKYGCIEIVLERGNGGFYALTMQNDGQFTPVSYWIPGQI